MTELETIARAQMYIDKLANGINPLDNTVIPAGDVIHQERIAKCLFYVSGVLGRVIENGGISATPTKDEGTQRKPRRQAVVLTPEQRAAFQPSERPIPITELERRINALAGDANFKACSYLHIRDWLLKNKLLYAKFHRNGTYKFNPSPKGLELGITEEAREGAEGVYQVILYSKEAQRHIVRNLDAIYALHEKIARPSYPAWTREEEDRLLALFAEGTSLIDMSLKMQRETSSIQNKLKKLKFQIGTAG